MTIAETAAPNRQTKIDAATPIVLTSSPSHAAQVRMRVQQAWVLSGDEPCPALIGQVRPYPVERDGQPVPEADQEIDVGRAPRQPREAAGHPAPAEIDDGRLAPDCRQIAD